MKKSMKNAGFTLVELIVVIAILGILAGVGTVAYTGYVEKAKEAADQQLLSAVNLAFASACIDSGTDINMLTKAEVSTEGEDGHKKVTGASSTQISDSDFSANFMKYFAGNEESEFQTGTPSFNSTTHLFELPKEIISNYSYGGGTIKISSADVDKLKKSTFLEAAGLGVDGLLAKVNDVSKFTAALSSSSTFMSGIYKSDAFVAYAAKAMGMPEGTTYEQLQGKLGTLASESGAQASDIVANATVVFAASTATKMDANEIADMFNGEGGAYSSIMEDFNDNKTSEAMAKAAIAYGMYTAYAHSSYGSADARKSADNPVSALTMLGEEGFQDYMKTQKAQTDLEGYLAALKMIDDSADDTSAVTEAITKGFNDPNLVDVFKQAVGQN